MEMRNIDVHGGGGGTIYDFREAEALMRVLQAGAETSSYEVRAFEEEFAAFVGAKYALALSNCVAALHLPLLFHGFKPGDEVIVPAMTFRATANPAEVQGGNVKFVDALDETFNIDSSKIEEKITEKTKAIYPVHMCGQPCDMDPILKIAKKYEIPVIEDAAHAAGASYKGRKVGSIGDYTAFSFQMSKNMSTLGEGGMLTTDNKEAYESIKELHSNGQAGLNYRMTDAQGAVGRVQLKKLPNLNMIRKRNTEYIFAGLSNLPSIKLQKINALCESSYHLANILIYHTTMFRDDCIITLKEKYGIQCATQYSPIVPLQSYYQEKYNVKKGDYPIAEDLAERVVSVPVGPKLKFPEDLDYIIRAFEDLLS